MERRRTDRRKQLEAILALSALFLPTQVPITGSYVNLEDIEWGTVGRPLPKSRTTFPPDSGQKSQSQKDVGLGAAQGGIGDTATLSCSGAPATPTASLGCSPSGMYRKAFKFSTAATTPPASGQSTYSLVASPKTSETWTPRDDGTTPAPNVNSPEVPFCGEYPVETIPLFVTRDVISGHELFLNLLCAAVNRAQRGVLGYLETSEAREPDVWRQQDYRLAQVILILSDESQHNLYSKAFFKLYGVKAHAIRHWWRNRPYLYRLCELGGSCTPLLHRDIAYKGAIIPDFDYAEVGHVGTAVGAREVSSGEPERKRPGKDSSGRTSALRNAAANARG